MVKLAMSMVILVLLSATAHGTVFTHCINNCTGISNGDYNSCDQCNEFVTCSEGTITKTPCPPGTVFDADKKFCDWTSNTCTESDSTSSPTTQSDPTTVPTTSQATTREGANSTSNPTTRSSYPDVQTTESPTSDSEMSSSTSSPMIQSNSSYTQTPISPSTINDISSSQNSPTAPSSSIHVQTTKTQETDLQTSVSTIQSDSSITTAQTTANKAGITTFLYVKVQYATAPCVAEARVLGSIRTRSKIECGSICYRSTKCWYFQHRTRLCLMYERTSPPCYTGVYRYGG